MVAPLRGGTALQSGVFRPPETQPSHRSLSSPSPARTNPAPKAHPSTKTQKTLRPQNPQSPSKKLPLPPPASPLPARANPPHPPVSRSTASPHRSTAAGISRLSNELRLVSLAKVPAKNTQRRSGVGQSHARVRTRGIIAAFFFLPSLVARASSPCPSLPSLRCGPNTPRDQQRLRLRDHPPQTPSPRPSTRTR